MNAFRRAHWSLAMVLAWITHRAVEAVEAAARGSLTTTKFDIADLTEQLRSDALRARGLYEDDKAPHDIDPADWWTLKIEVKRAFFAGVSFAGTNGTAAIRLHDRILVEGVTLPAAKVKRLWPAKSRMTRQRAAEKECRNHLIKAARESLDRQPGRIEDLLRDCQARFSGLSGRAFLRARKAAIKETGARWDAPGAPPQIFSAVATPSLHGAL